jgi:hypothetical protein
MVSRPAQSPRVSVETVSRRSGELIAPRLVELLVIVDLRVVVKRVDPLFEINRASAVPYQPSVKKSP